MHLDDRISLEPGTPKKGQSVRIEYRGLLAQSGADAIWSHMGKDGWTNIQDVPMQRTPEGNFSCTIDANATREINLCFKDSADHFDNNNGQNWCINIS